MAALSPNVRLLHLEDNDRDAALVSDLLDADGINCEITRAGCRRDYVAALEKTNFNLILCDFNLPDFDGLTALKLARAKYPEIPFILVSGSMNAENAVQCLKAGTTDYLLKRRLERLPSAVRRALDEADEHRRFRHAESALRESEARFRQLIENASEAIMLYDVETGLFSQANQAAERLFKLPVAEICQIGPAKLSPPLQPDGRPSREKVPEVVAQALAGGTPVFEWIHRNAEGGDILCEVRLLRLEIGARVFIRSSITDITERKRLETQLLRTQRLESIGTLAGGIAHDLNNALAPILMSIEMIRMDYPKEHEALDLVAASTRRAADMVQQLLQFAKGAEGERLSLPPDRLVKELEKIIGGTFPKNIRLDVRCAAPLPNVVGDSTQLHQVLLNLCVNARDAMPEGGTLTLEAKNQEVDEVYASTLPDGRPGHYVTLSVTDTGAGIPPAILDRIFDPFFTTKGPEKGTGLGLSTVMGIVKGHRGFLQVRSQLGQGSIFTVYLPAGAVPPETDIVAKPAARSPGRGETVLFVDDEAVLRKVGGLVLQRLNFKPLTATDGADGLIKATEHRAELRAIITDLHMPRMDGLAFVRSLRRILPDIPIVIASGRMDDETDAAFKAVGVTSRLDKPFTEAQLTEALQHLLSAR